MLPSVSIIIPCYNAADHISQALKSLDLKCIAENCSIIIIDNDSEDATTDVIEAITFNYISVELQKYDSEKGPGAARNHGLNSVTSDWVLFMDSDDKYDTNGISQLIEFINSSTLNCDIAAFNGTYTDGHNSRNRTDLKLLPNNREQLIHNYLSNRIDPTVMLYLFNTSFLKENNLRFRAGLHEDLDFMFQVLTKQQSLDIIPINVYIKIDTPNSIINTYSALHLDGYFQAITNIFQTLKTLSPPYWAEQFSNFVATNLGSRVSRVLSKACSDISFKEFCLKVISFLKSFEPFLGILSKLDKVDIHTQKIKWVRLIAIIVQKANTKESIDWNLLENTITLEIKKTWSCYDIQSSVFLAPDQVRTCCKRYYHNNQMMGDAVLFDDAEFMPQFLNFDNIVNEKSRLRWEINNGTDTQCTECPHLKLDNWPTPLSSGIKYLSVEYHSLCNMRCNYCSEIYWGGKKPKYDIQVAIDSFADKGQLNNCDYIVWGGGEPTLEKQFDTLFEKISNVSNTRQRIITNASIYKENLAQNISEDKAFIVTSIDAGNEYNFTKVRGHKRFQDVMTNLQRYAQINPENIIVKYILQEDNSSFSELKEFASLVTKYNLEHCNFQISCNFKTQTLDDSILKSILALDSFLRDIPVNFIFWDDLVWQRLPRSTPNRINNIIKTLKLHGVDPKISNANQSRKIIVWGTGAQSELLCKKTLFLRQSKIKMFVDPRKEMWGKKFMGKPVVSPSKVKETDEQILIAAVQSAPFILMQIKKQKISLDRVINLAII